MLAFVRLSEVQHLSNAFLSSYLECFQLWNNEYLVSICLIVCKYLRCTNDSWSAYRRLDQFQTRQFSAGSGANESSCGCPRCYSCTYGRYCLLLWGKSLEIKLNTTILLFILLFVMLVILLNWRTMVHVGKRQCYGAVLQFCIYDYMPMLLLC